MKKIYIICIMTTCFFTFICRASDKDINYYADLLEMDCGIAWNEMWNDFRYHKSETAADAIVLSISNNRLKLPLLYNDNIHLAKIVTFFITYSSNESYIDEIRRDLHHLMKKNFSSKYTDNKGCYMNGIYNKDNCIKIMTKNKIIPPLVDVIRELEYAKYIKIKPSCQGGKND